MSQATASVSATAGAAEIPMNTFDNIFQFVHDVFNQYRSTFLFIAGTSKVSTMDSTHFSFLKFSFPKRWSDGFTIDFGSIESSSPVVKRWKVKLC